MSTPEIVTLCGSMRFFPQMLAVAAEQTVRGRIVVAPFQTVPPDQQNSVLKQRLDELHRHKIDLADHVLIVTDETGYIGESTRNEIAYAEATGKPVSVVQRSSQITTPVRPADDLADLGLAETATCTTGQEQNHA